MDSDMKSEEEVQDIVVEELDVPPKEGAAILEVYQHLKDGDLTILHEDNVEEINRENIGNLSDMNFLVEEYGPISLQSIYELDWDVNLKDCDVDIFKPDDSSNTSRNSFSQGKSTPIIHSETEYDERVLEAFSVENDINPAKGKREGSGAAMYKNIGEKYEKAKNWIMWRSPVSWAEQNYVSKDYDIFEELKNPEKTNLDIANELGSSLHFVEKLGDYIEWKLTKIDEDFLVLIY